MSVSRQVHQYRDVPRIPKHRRAYGANAIMRIHAHGGDSTMDVDCGPTDRQNSRDPENFAPSPVRSHEDWGAGPVKQGSDDRGGVEAAGGVGPQCNPRGEGEL